MRYLWLVAAFLAALIGVFVCRLLGLSREATATLAAIPMFLLLFPFIKTWMPKAKFTNWAIGVVFAAAVAWLLYLGISRFGG
jgi:phosphotransferase system  glucose/maltose/N-acetylglucosamine-specific IIC component